MNDESVDTMDAAKRAAEAGELFEWVAAFLATPGSDNAALADQLAERELLWIGPVRLRFDELHRLAGPEDQPTVERFDDEGIEAVEAIEEEVDEGWNPPPLVVTWKPEHEQLIVEDGNHRVEGLRRAGREDYWAVVGFPTAQSRDRFLAEAEKLD